MMLPGREKGLVGGWERECCFDGDWRVGGLTTYRSSASRLSYPARSCPTWWL